jgi:hypothetical protein
MESFMLALDKIDVGKCSDVPRLCMNYGEVFVMCGLRPFLSQREASSTSCLLRRLGISDDVK